MFTAVVHVVRTAAIPIVGAIRDRLYEYQDFKAILRRWLAALHLAFPTTSNEETVSVDSPTIFVVRVDKDGKGNYGCCSVGRFARLRQ